MITLQKKCTKKTLCVVENGVLVHHRGYFLQQNLQKKERRYGYGQQDNLSHHGRTPRRA